MIEFLCYPRCSTCQKAKKHLLALHADVNERNIATQPPTAEELTRWIKWSGLPIKKFFSTSGNSYKQANLKEKLPFMSQEEMIMLLASDGMLVKRPIIIKERHVLVGYKEIEVEALR